MAFDPTRPDPKQTLAKLVGVLVVVGVLAAGLMLPYVGGLGLVAGKAAGKFLNTTCKWHDSAPPQKTTVYASDGKTVIATLFSQDRVPISLDQVPKWLQQALIATEDRRFYKHHGVDLRGLIRSAINTSNGDTQGGSTLTMQYVKQVRYYQAGDDPKKQAAAVAVNLHRKMEDAQCALYIEGTLHTPKSQILQDYLNIAFFGEHSYGIQTAAETYFDKPASQLTLAESAMLVGLLRAPSAYDPYLHPEAAKARRDEVLQNLVDVGQLSQAAADKVKAQPVALATKSPPQVHEGCASAHTAVLNASFFCEYAVDWLETTQGIKQQQLETGGLKIVTTLDPKIQNSAQRHINTYVPAKSPMTAVLPVLDPKTGDVLAMASSKRYGTGPGETEQPIFTKYTSFGASTYKLFPLLAALSTGVPDSWQLTTTGSTGTYTPKNCLRTGHAVNGDANISYSATETLRTATAKSSNTFFVGLADQLFNCNLQPIVDIMTKLGMKGMQQHDPGDNPNLTYAQNVVDSQAAMELTLGSIPTSPLELTGAYAAVANGGKYNAPTPVESIQDSHGNAILLKRNAPVQAIAPQVAAQAVDILDGDTAYPGTSASVFSDWYAQNPSKVAGKTGTAESSKAGKNGSIWFAGMTPDLVATSAIINFDHTFDPSRGLVGQGVGTAYGDFAAKVWLTALRPSIVKRSWSWPDPSLVGDIQVPDILGQTPSDAKRMLSDAGLQMNQLGGDNPLGLQCASSEPYGTIGYYGPQRADRGDTITVCVSVGTGQTVVVAPPPTHHHTTPGGTQTTPGGGTTGTPTPPGHGHGHGH